MSPLSVSIWRGPSNPRFVRYEVPRKRNQTVLDVVTYVQRRIDPSLAYRFACRVGMCGSCAMTVNGVARWTCRTHVDKEARNDTLEIAPLKNLPVVKDLATDMRGFFDKWRDARGQFEGTSSGSNDLARVRPETRGRRLADAGIECIGCGICYASCDVVKWLPDYLGPAALNRAWTLQNDVRDGAALERLRAVAGDAGCHVCHTQMSCTEHCPKHLSPTAAIAGLKRLTAIAALRGEL